MDTVSLKSHVKKHPAFPRVPIDVMATYDELAFVQDNRVLLPHPVGGNMEFWIETTSMGTEVLHAQGGGIRPTGEEINRWLELDSKHWRYGKYKE